MREFTPSDWYWLADDGRLFSSDRATLVPDGDEAYAAWADGGRAPTRWPGDQGVSDLQAVLAPYGLFASLEAYAAAKRYDVETAGITVGATRVATDRASQAMLNGAYTAAQRDTTFLTAWKGADGTWSTLTASQIGALAAAVAAHVQACFATERACDSKIAAGTITSRAEVDAAFAAI